MEKELHPLGSALGLGLLLFSVIIHEFSHGWMALRHGDDTAQRMGRMTLNPIPHIDPIGTLLLPAICLLSGSMLFGWARPVPVDYSRLNDPARDKIKVSLIGPLSNIGLAVIGALGFRLIVAIGGSLPPGFASLTARFFATMTVLNLVLAFFNLIPIHPLDGSHVLAGILPDSLRERYLSHRRYGFFILIALMYFGLLRNLLGLPVAVGAALLLGT